MQIISPRARRHLAAAVVPATIGILLLIFSGDLGQAFGRAEVTRWTAVLGQLFLAVAATMPLRLLLLPYLDLGRLLWMATPRINRDGETERPGDVAASIAFAGGCFVVGILLLILSGTATAQVPPPAQPLLPVLVEEQRAHWPGMPDPAVLAGQVHKETGPCPSRTCWSPRAELRTARERGVGLWMGTKTARFDALAELRARHPTELADLDWDGPGLYDPRLQLRALVLKDRADYEAITGAATERDRLAMMLASYNGGRGNIIKRRQLCRGTAGCDEGRWFGHLELHSWQQATKQAGYGKSFAQINAEYPRLTMDVLTPRYRAWFAGRT